MKKKKEEKKFITGLLKELNDKRPVEITIKIPKSMYCNLRGAAFAKGLVDGERRTISEIIVEELNRNYGD